MFLEREGNGPDYSDPHYKMFLERLRVHGNSYELEMPLSGELLLVIKYEKEVAPSNGHRLQNLDALQHFLCGVNMMSVKTLWDPSKSDRVDESCQALFSPVEYCEGYIRNRTGCSHYHPTDPTSLKKSTANLIKRKCSHNIRDGIDESYRVYLNSLIKDGDAGLSKREKNLSSVSKRVKTETQDKLRDLGLLKSEVPSRGVSKSARLKSLEYLPDLGKFNSVETLRGVLKRDKLENNLRYIRGTEKAENLHTGPIQKDNHFVDESYQVVLNSLKKSVVPALEKQEIDTKVKDEDYENSTDSEVIVFGEDPFIHGYHTPFVTSKFRDKPIDVDNYSGTARQCKGDLSQFREKLMEVLIKPFDQTEYEDLYREIHAKRTKEGCRRLRHKEVVYPLGSFAPSYIDRHSDLKMKINSSKKNPHKVLILLRGFFFWLENVTLKGSFRPWKDPSCLKLLSQP